MGTWVRADANMGSPGGHVYRSSAKAMPKRDYSYRSGCEDWSNPPNALLSLLSALLDGFCLSQRITSNGFWVRYLRNMLWNEDGQQ